MGEVREVTLDQHAFARCVHLLLLSNATAQLGVTLRVHGRNAEGLPQSSWVGYLLHKLCWDSEVLLAICPSACCCAG